MSQPIPIPSPSTHDSIGPPIPDTLKQDWKSYALSDKHINGITLQKLQAILSEHEKWVEDGCNYRKPIGRADLSETDFSDSRFNKVFTDRILRDAILNGANLSNIDLKRTDLRGAELKGVIFSGTDICDTQLQRANLEEANLTEALNVTSAQFGGADLKRAQFPTGFLIEDAEQVDEWLKGANALYLLYLSLCLFSVIVAFSTGDLQIVTQTGQAKLPIIDIDLPILWFFYLSPMLIAVVYLAFRLNLIRAWEGVADLPAIYPDGKTVDRKIHPLLLNSIFLFPWQRLKEKHPAYFGLQTAITWFTVYVLPLLALLTIWGRFLVRQSWLASLFHVCIFGIVAIFSVGFRVVGDKDYSYTKRNRLYWRFHRDGWRLLFVPVTGFTLLLMYLTFGSFGWLGKEKTITEAMTPLSGIHESEANSILKIFGLHPEARLVDSDISSGKPQNWEDTLVQSAVGNVPKPMTLLAEQGDKTTPLRLVVHPDKSVPLSEDSQWQAFLAPVQGAKLDGANLRGMWASGAFLAKANLLNSDLTDADLSQARLHYADLRGADLRGANLQKAYLFHISANFNDNDDGSDGNTKRVPAKRRTNLSGANLDRANLFGANLYSAILTGARLTGANFRQAYLTRVNLTHTNSTNANFMDAYLSSANLTDSKLVGANLTRAKLLSANLTNADLTEAKLTLANLAHAQLSNTNLTRADLSHANLADTDLTKADLFNTILVGALYTKGEKRTRFPNGFDPDKAGMIEIDNSNNGFQ